MLGMGPREVGDEGADRETAVAFHSVAVPGRFMADAVMGAMTASLSRGRGEATKTAIEGGRGTTMWDATGCREKSCRLRSGVHKV